MAGEARLKRETSLQEIGGKEIWMRPERRGASQSSDLPGRRAGSGADRAARVSNANDRTVPCIGGRPVQQRSRSVDRSKKEALVAELHETFADASLVVLTHPDRVVGVGGFGTSATDARSGRRVQGDQEPPRKAGAEGH